MYMPILPAANSALMPPQSSRKLLPMESSPQRNDFSVSRASFVPGLARVEVIFPLSLVCIRPPIA